MCHWPTQRVMGTDFPPLWSYTLDSKAWPSKKLGLFSLSLAINSNTYGWKLVLFDELASAAGKELAKEQITNDINSILGGEREVLRVSFGQFIIQ